MKLNLLFLDTETTGIKYPRLVELGLLKEGEGEETLSFIVKPPTLIEEGAEKIHGITNEFVKNCDPFTKYAEVVQNIVDESVIVAHNISFDHRVLDGEGIAIHTRGICTMKLTAFLIKQGIIPKISKKLQNIRELFGIDDAAIAHSAGGDVDILKIVFWRLAKVLATFWKLPIDSDELIEKMIEVSNLNPKGVVMPKGCKYEGMSFSNAFDKDQRYVHFIYDTTESGSLKKNLGNFLSNL